jgi:hypothetical protein
MAAMAAGAWTPGGEYSGTPSYTNASYDPFRGNLLPYNQNVTVIGSIWSNDVAMFTDRSGRFVRGTNLLGLVTGATSASTGAVALATAANTAATNAQALATAALSNGVSAAGVTGIVNAAIAQIPQPTGAVFWRDANDSNVFATVEGNGTGMFWKVSTVMTPDTTRMTVAFTGVQIPAGPQPWTSPITVTLDGQGNALEQSTSASGEWMLYLSRTQPASCYLIENNTYNDWLASDLTMPGTMPVTLVPHAQDSQGTALITYPLIPVTVTNFVTRIATTNDVAAMIPDYSAIYAKITAASLTNATLINANSSGDTLIGAHGISNIVNAATSGLGVASSTGITNNQPTVTFGEVNVQDGSVKVKNGSSYGEFYHSGSATVLKSVNGNLYLMQGNALVAFVSAAGLFINTGKELSYGGNEDVQTWYDATGFYICTKSRWGSGTVDSVYTHGNVVISNNVTVHGLSYIKLPTSAAGLPSGTLWNDGGTVKVAP